MKAVACRAPLPIEHPDSLVDLELPEPLPRGHELLVEVRAIAVNPVDTKVRRSLEPGEPRVLGWDAAGVVRQVGEAVTLFRPGDRVWYAGALERPGCNAELQCVDERLAGPMPEALDFAAAAALPLTAITAWELLFDRLGLQEGGHQGQTLLVVGAAGGVGSILLQLARQLTGLTLIGSASRPNTLAWVEDMGAHHVIDHSRPLSEELQRLGLPQVDYLVSLNHTQAHFPEIARVMAPQGRFGLIDDPGPLDIRLLKEKSVSLHWEFMFTRSRFATPDLIAQHRLLARLAGLVQKGRIRSTRTGHFGPICAAGLKRAHALLESGRAQGKIVLEGF